MMWVGVGCFGGIVEVAVVVEVVVIVEVVAVVVVEGSSSRL